MEKVMMKKSFQLVKALWASLVPYTTLFRSICPRRQGPGRVRSLRDLSPPDPEHPEPHHRHRNAVHPRHDSRGDGHKLPRDRKSTRLNSSHVQISYAVFCLKKKRRKQSKWLK